MRRKVTTEQAEKLSIGIEIEICSIVLTKNYIVIINNEDCNNEDEKIKLLKEFIITKVNIHKTEPEYIVQNFLIIVG